MADVWIKFCGCTSWSDVELAIEAGADAFGMIFAPSPRRITKGAVAEIARRIPDGIEPVAVFVNPGASLVDEICGMFSRLRLQFSGEEAPAFVAAYADRAIKAIHVGDDAARITQRAARFPHATLLLEARHEAKAGGTGRTFPWEHAVPIARERPVVIAGGLTPANVAECVARVRPFGVDVRSGIESSDCKDVEKMRAFVRAVSET